MSLQHYLIVLGKVLVASFVYLLGLFLGGAIANGSGIQPPELPPGMDANQTLLIMALSTPLLVLALVWLGQGLIGGRLSRATMLALLTWIAYTVNNAIEATVFSSYVTAPWFTLLNFSPAIFLCALTTAWLFPPRHPAQTFTAAWRAYFGQRPAPSWLWRIALAAVSFMPIYYGVGLLVVPFVGDYYAQGAFGLLLPSLPTLLTVLLVRSLLFFVATLPILVAWRGAWRGLWLRLGFAHFVMVGLLYLLAATWLPLAVRTIHGVEILLDSYLYVGALLWLLNPGGAPVAERQQDSATNQALWPI